MTLSDFNSSVRSAFEFLKDCGLDRTARILRSHNVSDEFKEKSVDPEISYKEIYQLALRNGDYNILLKDFAFFQFAFFKDEHYRLGYYPNPFVLKESYAHELDEALEAGAISFEEYSDKLADSVYEVTRPLVRFEVDCAAYIKLVHPAAHFHIGMHSENRWPVSHELTPRIFTMFIIKLYYHSMWEIGKLAPEGEFFNCYDKYFCNEKGNCKIVVPILNEHERTQLYVG